MAADEGIKIDQVRVNDDIPRDQKIKGMEDVVTTATPIILKIAGSASSTGLEIEPLKEIVQRAVDNSRSLGVSLSACSLPETGMATFSLEDGKMEFGMGLHGEAGN